MLNTVVILIVFRVPFSSRI